MTSDDHARIAHAVILLKQERATNGVMHVLTLLDSVLPLPGTPERREAFSAARATRSG